MNYNSQKIGLVLSHIHVRPGEEFKFDMLEYVISHFNNMKTDFYIVLSGHGLRPSDQITSKVHQIIWKDTIVQKEIGVGHPYFCIESFKTLQEHDIRRSVKIRSCDLILNESFFEELITADIDLILTEQTCLKKGMIGDLLMMGETKKLLELWTSLPWNYNKSGLYNLFDNACFLASQFSLDISDYLKKNAKFISPDKIKWVTLENNWNKSTATPESNLEDKHLWGAQANYHYYGGF